MAKESKKETKGDSVSDSIKKRLKAMRERWDESKKDSKKDNFGNNVEDGAYVTKLTDASIVEGRNDSIGVVFKWSIVEGDYKGEALTRWAGFDTDERVVYLQRDLRRLNVDVDDFDVDDLPDILKQLIAAAPTTRLKVKTNGEYTNVYIDKILEDYEPETSDGEDTTSSGGTEKEEEKEDVKYEPKKGDDIVFELKGKKTAGKILKVWSDDTCQIGYGDDQVKDVPNDELSKAEEEVEEKEEKSEKEEKEEKGPKFAIDDKVSYKLDGKKGRREGIVKKVYDDDTVDVKDKETKETHNISTDDAEALATVK